MRAVIQRVSRAHVRVEGSTVGAIGPGYVALIGVERGDGEDDVSWLSRKITSLRLWPDADGKMNIPLSERQEPEVLAISQFTLLADCRRGLRPSFDAAAKPEEARPLYEALVASLRSAGVKVATGVFQADMELELVNQGPVTISLDSRVK
ncbi:MAG TPA: D-aminoacyl-tRNA deacylase [Terriglobales bacterium]